LYGKLLIEGLLLVKACDDRGLQDMSVVAVQVERTIMDKGVTFADKLAAFGKHLFLFL
jgi:hypothetical protein